MIKSKIIITLGLFILFGNVEAIYASTEEVKNATNSDNKQKAIKLKDQSYNADESFGSPSEPGHQLEEDIKDKDPVIKSAAADEWSDNWHDYKRQVYKDTGLQFGIDYTAFYQSVDKSLTENDYGASGILRFYGKWDLFNKDGPNEGALVFKIDDRSKLGNGTTPAGIGGDAGYVGQTAFLFSDVGTVLVDLNWQQKAFNGKGGFIVGRYDPSDYMNILGYTNPWDTFSNLGTSLDNSIAYPDVGLGAGAAYWLDNNWYVLGGFNDANSLVDELHFYKDGAEFFKFAEIGWSISRDKRFFNNIHLTTWHVDTREKAGIDSAYGFNIGINHTWNSSLMLFGKVGWSDVNAENDPQIYEKSITAGFLYFLSNRSDNTGIAINWGEHPNYPDPQLTIEAFYKLQLTENITLTPNFQVIKNPAFNDESQLIVSGVRFRVSM